MKSTVRCVIEKHNDEGYIHFDQYVPVEFAPIVGEVIELFYPDGGYNQYYTVKSIQKVFGSSSYQDLNSGFYLKVIVK